MLFLFDILYFCFKYLIKADAAVVTGEDGFASPIKMSFYIEDFGSFVALICNTIAEMCP